MGFMKQVWKRGISIGLAFSMTVLLVPADFVSAAYPSSVPALTEEVKRIPEVRKAGSIPASEQTITYEQPFAPFTGGSESFRIPTLISLQYGDYKGDLFASADARWEEWNDGGGIDSIASVSSDGGATWNYSFPIYFPDSYGFSSKAATTVIDPGAIEGTDGTLYFIADVNPTGSTTMYKTIGTGTGYVTVGEGKNAKRRLALTDNYGKVGTMPTDDNLTDYPYYVEEFNEDGYARILKRADNGETGYGVDEWYNIYSIDEDGEYIDDKTQPQVNRSEVEIQQNCYYKGSDYHVYQIDYLWVVQSKDGGRTWEHPRDITDQIKRYDAENTGNNDRALLVSPGKGITTQDGEIAIGFYSAQNGEHASMVYSKDNGKTWKRTNDITDTSSEDEIVQLEDGTLRMFYRSGGSTIRYADLTRDEETKEYVMGTFVDTGVPVKASINVSAVLHSQKINGKQVILVARSGGGSGLTSDSRLNGKIFTFLVDDTRPGNPMELYYTFNVPNGADGFVYSCMTELEDGRIAILWEPNHSTLYFDIFDFEEITGTGVSLELKKNDASYEILYTEEPNEADCGDSSIIKLEKTVKEGIFLRDHITDNPSNLNSFSSEINEEISMEEAEFTFQQAAGANNWNIYNESTGLYIQNSDGSNMFTDSVCTMTVTPVDDNGMKRFKIKNGSRPIFFYASKMDFNAQSSSAGDAENLVLLEKQETESEDDIIPGYARASEITSGKNYLITYLWEEEGKKDVGVIVLYPRNGSTAAHTKLASVDPKQIKISGLNVGTTKVVIDKITYKIMVTDPSETISLEKGDTYFLQTENLETVPDGEGIVGVEKVDKIREGLFDHESDRAFSLEGYAEEANEDIDLSDAEFTFKSSGSNWIVSHEDFYLSNPENAYAFFTETAAAVKVTVVDGNKFHIARATALPTTDSNITVSEDKSPWSPIGNLVFYYREMNFRSYGTDQKAGTTHGASPYGQHASYDLTLLEKQDVDSDDDIVPGYRIAGSVTDGGTYLISYIWNDNIFILYPENGLSGSTKLINKPKQGFCITAERAGECSIVVDEKTYHFQVTDAELSEAKASLEQLLNQFEKEYSQKDNTLTSWSAFQAAYEAAKQYIEQTDAIETDKLKDLFTALETQQQKLTTEKIEKAEKEATENTVQTGDSQVVDGVSYTVTDTANKTVSVTGGTAGSVVLLPTVVIKNETYKVTAIAKNAFSGSAALKKVTVGSNIESIGDQAFANCKNLKSVIIGKDVKTIGKKAFFGCKKLSKVTVKGTSKLNKVGKSAFNKTSAKIKIKLPANLKKNKKLKNQIKKAGIKKGV